MYKRFLLADDDADDRQLFSEALTELELSASCHMASNGQEVLDTLGRGDAALPEIIFLDINMPEVNGWECLASLQSNSAYRDIPVIMYSTSSAKRDSEKALSLGAIGLYEKPSNFNQLKAFLRSIANCSRKDLPGTVLAAQESRSNPLFTG